MSLQKKNVIQEFIKDEYVPTEEQFLVKYCSGKGNNLHEVDCVDGNKILVSMPKKYRQTVWLKKDDCLVIDPIEEGKKVKGEILCVLSSRAVRDLIVNHQWPTKSDSHVPVDVDNLLQFFTKRGSQLATSNKEDDLDLFPPSDSSELETEEEEEEELDKGKETDDANDNL